jgi:hypothetical protein
VKSKDALRGIFFDWFMFSMAEIGIISPGSLFAATAFANTLQTPYDGFRCIPFAVMRTPLCPVHWDSSLRI